MTPNVGVTYSGSTSKLAEHGGFAHDDTNVILLLSNPSFQPQTVRAEVGTAQVAPTILDALGLDPSALDAVRKERARRFCRSSRRNLNDGRRDGCGHRQQQMEEGRARAYKPRSSLFVPFFRFLASRSVSKSGSHNLKEIS